MPTHKISTIDIIKFIWATAIFLLWFLWKWEKVGETDQNIYFQNYLQQTNTEDISHQSADIKDKCASKNKLCKKIINNDIKDIIPYTNEIYDVSYFINDNEIIPKKIIDVIKEITIKSDPTQRRWYATWNTVVFNLYSIIDIIEFRNLVSHELGHILDLGNLQGTKRTKSTIFTEFNKPVFAINDPSLYYYNISRNSERVRKSWATKKDFCSGYGMTNPFEDFAECFNLYINHQSFFRFIANKNKSLALKYNFIATLLQWNYLEKNTSDLAFLKNDYNWRTRDSTKL